MDIEWQTIISWLIIALALFFFVRAIVRIIQRKGPEKGGCNCECGNKKSCC